MPSLGKYKEKRKFDQTSEPKGKIKTRKNKPLRFVIQKHKASSLHYDLRLEIDGVLKSWAIPKGPSMDPTNKHLAIKVEDHPYEYKDFEGVIPKGNYGAGTVMIWDEGYFKPLGALAASTDLSSAFKEGLKKGHLVFALAGSKLSGEFALIKLGHGSKNDWLIVKARDWYSSDKDVLLSDKSTRSGLSMEEISMAVPKFPKIDPKTPKDTLPHDAPPMTATLIDKPFDKKGWSFEVKWDGYRAITEIKNGKVRIYSRNGKNFNEKFSEVYSSFVGYPKDVVFDGEIVAVDKKGRSDFQLLQDYMKTGKGTLVYYIFDVIYFDGYNLTSLPLKKRRSILNRLLPRKPNIRFSEDVQQNSQEFFEAAKKAGLEGIMAKSNTSLYHPGQRVHDWLKIKNLLQQEVIICGFTKPKGTRAGFGALILGAYEDNALTYIGYVGTGFDEATIKDLTKKMKSLTIKKSPFQTFPRRTSDVTWIKPELVAEIKFQEWTKDGYMRQPVFLGLREDKSAENIRKELPAAIAASKPSRKTNDAWHFTNPDKVFWPKSGITKGNLSEYYEKVSEYILPHLKGRPQSLNRFPNGINNDNFFQKNIESPPSWMKTYKDTSGIDQHIVNYAICDDNQTLQYIINLGCIDLNVWNSRTITPEKPDFMVFDLDPVDIDFKFVLQAALAIKTILDSVGIKSYPKTSGKRGMHIYIPLSHKYTFQQVRDFAHLVSIEVHQALPKITSLERQPKSRQGKVYLDYLQNRKGATMAAPYTVRPVENACVSTPLTWGEVEKGVRPEDFTIKNIAARLETIGDIFAPTLGKGVNLSLALGKLQAPDFNKTRQ